MGTKRQTSSGLPEQLSFGWGERGRAGHGPGSDAVSEAAGQVVEQVSTAEERIRALKQDLMEKVAEEVNLLEALRRVCANKGSAGVDGMDVTELKAWMSVRANREKLRDKLISGEYEPVPVRGVQIPKPGGKGVRQLGIPTVVDRLVQQALLQVLELIYDSTFSEGSYGFRPGRGAHDALRQASQYVANTASQRQAGIGAHRAIPSSRDDVERGLRPAGRRHAARRATQPTAGEHTAGRLGQGTGKARSPVLSVRRRL